MERAKQQKHKGKLGLGLIIGGFTLMVFLAWSSGNVAGQAGNELTDPQVVADLNNQIEQKRQRIEELKQQSGSYQQAVDQAVGQVRDLQSQLTAITNQIAQTSFEIQGKETEVEKIELEMQAVQASIDSQTEEMNSQKEQLGETLQRLDQTSRTPLLNLLLVHDNFSEFFDQAQALASLSDSLEASVQTIRQLKDELQAKHTQLGDARDEIEQVKLQLEINRQASQDQQVFQGQLLASASQTESQYNDLLQQSIREEQQANATIGALERQLQLQLNGGETPVDFTSTGFLWPLRGTLTAYFHDPTYPFSCKRWKSPYCMEHSGLDIAVPQGTPVRATADGIVSVMNDQGWYYDDAGRKIRSALNFIGLVHANGISSRYLHLSAVYVRPDQFVKQGEVIGLSGGLPGTAGAGGITTGAHLHFEVRVDGIPDDPLRYLD